MKRLTFNKVLASAIIIAGLLVFFLPAKVRVEDKNTSDGFILQRGRKSRKMKHTGGTENGLKLIWKKNLRYLTNTGVLRLIGELNESYVKIAKFKGEFTWHIHDNEDEMFYVVKGVLTVKFKDKDIFLREGETIIIPKGTEHMPVAEEEVHVLLIESKSTLNTGNVVNEKTVKKPERL